MNHNSFENEAINKFLDSYRDNEGLRRYFLRKFDHPDQLFWQDKETDYRVDFLFVNTEENIKFWTENFSAYSHLYIHASLANWSERFSNDQLLKRRCDEYLEKFSKEIKSNIEQILLKGDKSIIPLGMIKLAISLRIKTSIFAYTETASQNKQDEIVTFALDKAADDLDILRKNQSYLEFIDQLSLASHIRDVVVNDENTTKMCTISANVTSLRKKLLDDIKMFQLSVINKVKSETPAIKAKHNSIIKDFNEAKDNLRDLVRTESNLYQQLNRDIHSLMLNNQQFTSHLERLSIVEDNCSNEHYSVLIMGEYQTGKTTTLNAICKGMQIGAIGNGITTSAVPVSVSYSEDENVIISWKDKKLIQDFLKHLIPHFPNFNYEIFDIDNNTERLYWLKQLENIRKEQDFFVRKGESQIKFLALCAAILNYYGSKELQILMNTSLSLSVISSISKFPEELSTKWCSNGIESFSLEECAFVFIKKISCTCNSDLLKKLNCEIIDCPGLFSSAYDTEITTSFMTEVDAILYILPYEKEIGKQVCESLYYIKNNFQDIHRKLFLANNISLTKETNFYEANLRKAKQLFGKETDLILYDATLAYLGQIKLAYEKGILDEITIDQFIERSSKIREAKIIKKSAISKLKGQIIKDRNDYYFKSFEDAWNYRIRPYDIDEHSSVHEIIEQSGLFELTDNLISFIEKNRAYSLIVSNGINRLSDSVSNLKVSLTTCHVEPYILGKEETVRRWEERLVRCDNFNEQMKVIISNYIFKASQNTKSLSSKLARTVYCKLFTKDIYDGMIDRICYTLFSNKFTLFKLRKKEQELKAFVNPLIEKDITEVIASRISYWNEIMKSGQDEDFKIIFEPSMRELASILKEKWISIYSGNNDRGTNDESFINAIQQYFCVPTDTKDFYINSLSNESNLDLKSDNLTQVILLQISVTIGQIAMAITSYICYLAAASAAGGAVVVSNPVGWLFGAIGLISGAGILYFKGEDWILAKFNKKIKPQIISQFEEKNLYYSFEDAITSEVEKLLKDFSYKIRADKKKMEEDRDVASSKSEVNLEFNCFSVVESISVLNKIITSYNKFIADNVEG